MPGESVKGNVKVALVVVFCWSHHTRCDGRAVLWWAAGRGPSGTQSAINTLTLDKWTICLYWQNAGTILGLNER